jgi:hypothetical protein
MGDARVPKIRYENARSFSGMGAADSRSLRYESYVRKQHFVRRSTYFPFRRFWGDVRR